MRNYSFPADLLGKSSLRDLKSVGRGFAPRKAGTQDDIAHLRDISSVGIAFTLEANARVTRVRYAGLSDCGSVKTGAGIQLQIVRSGGNFEREPATRMKEAGSRGQLRFSALLRGPANAIQIAMATNQKRENVPEIARSAQIIFAAGNRFQTAEKGHALVGRNIFAGMNLKLVIRN